MKYEKKKDYADEKFRRISGVKRKTFEEMIEILRQAYAEKHKKGGRPPKLILEDTLLATLEYLREYRTYAQIAASYGIDESNMWHLVKWVEEVLIKCGKFNLPGKKALLSGEVDTELKDVTESPIERPKKNEREI